MARADVQRVFNPGKKYDASSKLFSLDFGNISPSTAEFGRCDFRYSPVTFVDKTSTKSDPYGDKKYSDHSESPLSHRARGTRKREDSNCKVDASLSNSLNACEAEICDQKSTDFSDILSSVINEDSNMKLKDNSVGETLFDLLPNSFQEHDPSSRTCNGRSLSPVCNLSFSDITVPEFHEEKNLNTQSEKNVKSLSESEFSLSDILSSICIDDSDRSASKLSKESSLRCDQNLCLDDFDLSDVKLSEINVAKNDTQSDVTPNLLLSFDFTDGALCKSKPDKIEDNKYSGSLKSNEVDSFSCGISSNKQAGLDCLNILDLLEDASKQNVNSLGTSLDSTKSTGFSFFCDPSENQLTFSEMLDDDNRNVIKPHRNDSCSDQDSISMLDLYNSIQSSKQSSSASESNSSTSDEIERKDGLTWLTSTSEEDDDQDVAIDLSTCIKSFEDKTSFIRPAEIDVVDQNLQSTPEPILQDTPILSLPLRNIITTQAPRMNLKQSLFAKSLSCKAKRNPALLQKVANIKAELFNKVFDRSLPVENNPRIEVATFSDRTITQCNGRRNFGMPVGVSG